MTFTSKWFDFQPARNTETRKSATDKADKSPQAPPSVSFVSSQVTRSEEIEREPSPCDPAPKNLETRTNPTDRTDKSPSVSFVSSLLARFRENERPEALTAAAAELLSHYQRQAPTLPQWLEHFDDALSAIRATFPPDRRPHALATYKSSYVDGRPAELVAAHTVALQLWAADERQHPNGYFLDAAFTAAGLEVDADTCAAPFLALTPEKPVTTGPNDRSTHSLLAGRHD